MARKIGTGRKQTEAELKLKEGLLDSASDSIFLHDLDGHIFYLNEAAYKSRGYEKEELLKKNISVLPIPEYAATREKLVADLLGKGEMIFESAHFRKDGSILPVEIHARVLNLNHRQLILSVARDITERKQAEEEIARLASFPQLNPNPVLEVDLAGNITFINYAALMKAKKMGLQDLRAFLPADLREILKAAIGKGERQSYREVEIKDAVFAVHIDFTPQFQVARLFIIDITERKRAEEELRLAAYKWRTTFDAIGDAVCLLDLECKILQCNQAMADLVGKPFSEIVGSTCWQVVHGAAGPIDGCPFGRMMKSRQRETFIFPAGDRWFKVTVDPILDRSGSLTGAVHIVTDITAYQNLEKQINSEKTKFQALAENSPFGLAMIDQEGVFTYINPKFKEMLGYDLPEIPNGKAWFRKAFPDADYRSQVISAWVQDLKRAKPGEKRPRTFTVTCKDGSEKIISFISVQLADGDHFTTCEDITERQRAEGALREGERFLSSVFACIQDGLSILDLDYQIVRVNPTMEQWYAHARPLVGQKCYQAYQGRDHPCDPCPTRHAMATGKPHSDVILKRGPQQEVVGWLEVHAYPRLDRATGKMTGVIEYIRDITQRQRAEEALEKSLRELRQTLEGTVMALANTVEMRDPYTAGHQLRVAQLACALAQEMGLSPDQLEGIRVMGFLHDIGKIGIPAEILNKPGRLNEVEGNLVKTHAVIGYAILKDLEFPWPVAQAILQHHERLDGSGYPSGLSDRQIILEARILAVADVVEAMASFRPYRPVVGIDLAMEEISRNRGRLYDPEVVDVCLRLFKEKGFKFD